MSRRESGSISELGSLAALPAGLAIPVWPPGRPRDAAPGGHAGSGGTRGKFAYPRIDPLTCVYALKDG